VFKVSAPCLERVGLASKAGVRADDW
jgi:hypothetical protein